MAALRETTIEHQDAAGVWRTHAVFVLEEDDTKVVLKVKECGTIMTLGPINEDN